jgi:hypothetical protein
MTMIFRKAETTKTLNFSSKINKKEAKNDVFQSFLRLKRVFFSLKKAEM